MTDRSKKIVKFIVRLVVTLVLLVLVFERVDFDQFWLKVKGVRRGYLVGVWASTVIFYTIQSMVLKHVLKRQGCEVSVLRLFGASSVTALYSLALPGLFSVGVKWFLLKKHTGRGSQVLSSMLYNQVMLSVTMMVVGLAALIVTNPTPVLFSAAPAQWILPTVCAVLLVSIVATCALLLSGRVGGAVVRFLTALLRPLPQGLQERGRRILDQLAVFQNAGMQFHLVIAGANAVDGFLVGLLIYFCAARAAHVTVGVGVLIWLCAVIYVLGKLPISVANLGVREVTLVGLLGAYGIAKPTALLMSMALFSAVLFMAAIGVMCQWVWFGLPAARSGNPTHFSRGTR